MSVAFKQGQGDGLCGLYALANFLDREDLVDGKQKVKRAREAIWFALEAAEQLGVLRAHYLWEGFAWYHLRDIANLVLKNIDTDYVAVSLYRLAQSADIDGEVFLEGLVDDGGYAIVAVDRGRHWVLAFQGPDESIGYADSSSGTTKISANLAEPLEGVALLPANSKLLKQGQ